jgi:hypothetical protein
MEAKWERLRVSQLAEFFVQRGFLRVNDTYASVYEEQGEGREAGREERR